MKVNITYSTRVRKSEDVEVRIEHKGGNAKFAKNITMAKDYLNKSNTKHEESYSKIYTLLFNMHMVLKNESRANKLLDKLLEKAVLKYNKL